MLLQHTAAVPKDIDRSIACCWDSLDRRTSARNMPASARQSHRCHPTAHRTITAATAMSRLAIALCFAVVADSFCVPARAMGSAHALTTGATGVAGGGAPVPRGSCSGFFGRVGGARKIRGGCAEAGGAAAASAGAAAVGDVDVLGLNDGVLSAEQRSMAETLLELGQVSVSRRVWERLLG